MVCASPFLCSEHAAQTQTCLLRLIKTTVCSSSLTAFAISTLHFNKSGGLRQILTKFRFCLCLTLKALLAGELQAASNLKQ